MTDAPWVRLLVLDTGPLITLAAAESLDLLSYPAAPIMIPDAVFYEATSKQGALGQQDIVNWAQARAGVIQVVPTNAFAAFLDGGSRRTGKGLGERAAFELLEQFKLGPSEFGALIAEDRAVVVAAQDDSRLPGVIAMTTADFLDLLETEGWINSADSVLEAAEDAGRHISRERALKAAHDQGMAALRSVMKKPI